MPACRRARRAPTMQIACGTSLQAALTLGAKIAIGEIDSGIAAGSDTVSATARSCSATSSSIACIELSRARTDGREVQGVQGLSASAS